MGFRLRAVLLGFTFFLRGRGPRDFGIGGLIGLGLGETLALNRVGLLKHLRSLSL